MAQANYRTLPPVWLLVGCARSGTPIHDHPTTAAWNALLCGCKLWAVFPPDVDQDVLLLNLLLGGGGGGKGTDEGKPQQHEDDEDDEDDEFDLSALQWFGRVGALPPSGKVIVQVPGEVVFLPAGWFHVVLNVETSTAISHSLMLRRDMPALRQMIIDARACGDTDRLEDLLAASGHLLEEDHHLRSI